MAEESAMREEVTEHPLPLVRFVTAEERDSLLWQRSLYRAHRSRESLENCPTSGAGSSIDQQESSSVTDCPTPSGTSYY